MGAMQNNPKAKTKKGRSRGKTDNEGRLKAFARSTHTVGADWGGCDPQLMQAVVVGITALGGAMTFGLSRDGGAHFVTLLLDDSRQTLWFNGDDSLDDALNDIAATIESLVE